MDEAVKKLNLFKEDILMVGDNLDTDILAGQQNGLDTLLVLTGVSSREDAEKREKQPTYIRNHLGEWKV